jgi:hypothetical protein
MTWAIFPGDEHLRAVIELVTAGFQPPQSDRIVAVVGGALLEEAVERTLRERLIDEPGLADSLLKPDKPLGNMRPQIDLLCLLGAFDEKTRQALKAIGGIRNFFAHHLDASFDSKDKKFRTSMTRLVLHENRTHYPHHLYGADTHIPLQPVNSDFECFVVNLQLALIILMRDRAAHEMHTNQALTEEQVRERFANSELQT